VTSPCELSDDVHWLPEISGDSDMPEDHWNVVSAAASRVSDSIVRSHGGSGYLAECKEIERSIDALLTIPAAAGVSPANSASGVEPVGNLPSETHASLPSH
jgi:hypothetical protein